MKQIVSTAYGKAKVYREGSGRKVMIVPGYSESITHNQELVDRLAYKGYDAFTFSQPRQGAAMHPLDRQRDIILSVLSSILGGSEKVYAVGHSFGAAALLRAVIKDPDQFTGLVLMQPSGIAGKHDLLHLVRQVGIKMSRNHATAIKRRAAVKDNKPQSVTHRRVIRAHAASTRLIIGNPMLAFKEGTTAIRHAVADDITAVQELGIQVHIIKAHDDELFGMKDLFDYDQIIGLAGSYSNLSHKSAGHDTFWMHPEQTAQLIDTFIRHDKI